MLLKNALYLSYDFLTMNLFYHVKAILIYDLKAQLPYNPLCLYKSKHNFIMSSYDFYLFPTLLVSRPLFSLVIISKYILLLLKKDLFESYPLTQLVCKLQIENYWYKLWRKW